MTTFKSDAYEDGRTKQSFKDSTDINKLLAKAARGESISHLAKHGAVYSDFSDIDDLLHAHSRLQKGREIFDDLPGEIKREFNQDAGAFFKFVNDPQNQDKLSDVLPALAQRGTQLPPGKRTPSNIDAVERQQNGTQTQQQAEPSPPPEETPPEA